MMHTLVAAAVSGLLVLAAPFFLIAQLDVRTDPALVVVIENQSNEVAYEALEESIKIKDGIKIMEMPLEEYLIGVVISEMPASFHSEALKAQAVAARTFVRAKMENGKHDDCVVCTNSSCCQAWRSEEDVKEKLGESYEKYYDKVRNAVNETRNEVMTYHGALIEAVYFSCSGGRTETAAAVWGNDLPYLQSVESRGEEKALRFESQKMYSIHEFQEILSADGGVSFAVDRPSSWIGKIEYTEGGGVASIDICGKTFSGNEMRALFGLNSTDFEIRIANGEVTFFVKGYGHRVGMSQYGANAMAEDGHDYQAILQHYYQGIRIEK